MTVTSWSFRPSQCSSCRESSWPLQTLLTLADLARSRPPRLGLPEGEAVDSEKMTFFHACLPRNAPFGAKWRRACRCLSVNTGPS